jgi:hypothetical protein
MEAGDAIKIGHTSSDGVISNVPIGPGHASELRLSNSRSFINVAVRGENQSGL